MRIYTRECEFPKTRKFTKIWFSACVDIHLKLWISGCGNAPENVYIRCADKHKFWCITACGDTQFNVNSHMRKSVFPRTRIYTFLSELPDVEIHKSMCKSTPAEIRFSPCGNPHEIVHFRMWKYTKNGWFPNVRKYSVFGAFPHAEIRAGKWISACQFTSGFVNFLGGKHAGIHDFSGISTCGNTRRNVNSRVRKYTRKGVLPHAVIHYIRLKKIVQYWHKISR